MTKKPSDRSGNSDGPRHESGEHRSDLSGNSEGTNLVAPTDPDWPVDQPSPHSDEVTASTPPARAPEQRFAANGFVEIPGPLDAMIAKYADDFNACTKFSAEQYVRQSQILVEAEDDIGKKHLTGFYLSTGVDPEGSKIKKLRVIGKKAQRFSCISHLLPDCWTTIYNLAKAPEDKFLALLQKGILTPRSTWADLRDHIMPAKTKQTAKPRPRITLNLDPVPALKRKQFVKQVKQICKDFNVMLPEAQLATLQDFAPTSEGEVTDA